MWKGNVNVNLKVDSYISGKTLYHTPLFADTFEMFKGLLFFLSTIIKWKFAEKDTRQQKHLAQISNWSS